MQPNSRIRSYVRKAAVAALVLAQSICYAGELDPEIVYRPAEFSDPVFGPSGSSVVYTRTEPGGAPRLHLLDLATGDTEPIDTADDDLSPIAAHATVDDGLVISASSKATGHTAFYLMDSDGQAERIGPPEGSRAVFLGANAEKGAVYLYANVNDRSRYDVVRMSRDGEAWKMNTLFENTTRATPGRVDPTETFISMEVWNAARDDDIHILHLPSGRSINFTADKAIPRRPANHGVEDFSASGEMLFTSNRASDYSRLLAADLNTGDQRLVYETEGDVHDAIVSSDGSTIAVHAIRESRSVLVLIDADTQLRKETDLPPGVIRSMTISNDGSTVALKLSAETCPPAIWTVDAATGAATRRTDPYSGAIASEQFTLAEFIRYESYDSEQIPALLYLPDPASAESPVAAVVWVHGGPGSESRRDFNPTNQLLVDAGFAVLAVNHRGSSGFGKAFHRADDRAHGDADLEDLVWAKRYLESRPEIDRDRIAVMGSSYGGYLTFAALTFRPEVFDAGIAVCGVTDWLRTLQSVAGGNYRQRADYFAEMGDPTTDAERLRSISPIHQAFRIVKPLLVVQGALDTTVPQVESDRLVEAVREAGGSAEYRVFEDEGHGIRDPANRVEAFNTYVDFLDRHIRGPLPPR